ncbi:SCAN domain-containing protein 3-like [Lissotriton helveticus]
MKRFLIQSSSSSAQSEVAGSSDKEDGKRKAKYRKYDDRYLDYGFTCVQVNNEDRPQCAICLKVLALESMLPSKLKRHLESLHPNVVGKPREFFVRKVAEAKVQKSTFSKQTKINSNALLSSYQVAYLVAQSKKPHTIAEELILPAAVKMVTNMVSEDAGKQLLKVPLSNNTVSRRVNDMAQDINDQLICNLRGKDFALQLNEATDNHKDTHLICYVRFVHEKQIVEDLLFCKEIKGGTTGQDLYAVVDDFMQQNQIDWERCVGVCTDGGRSMAGCYQGLQARIRSKAPNAVWTHCIIHREALAAGNLSEELHEDEVEPIKWVNNPFNAEIHQHFNNDEAEQLIDVASDLALKVRFQSQSLFEFWCQAGDEYPMISKRALHVLIPFATSNLCEAGFSAVAVIKSKYRATINLEKEIRVAISKIAPRFQELCKEKQAHPSH